MDLPLIALLVSGDTVLVGEAQKILDSKYYGFRVLVIATQDCPAYRQAKALGFDALLAEDEKEMMDMLEERQPALIVAAGYHKILSSKFVRKFKGKLVNFHPSLLPAFSGLFDLRVHAAVLARGCRISGATVHFIDEKVDTGKIIFQAPVAVDEFDTPETLKKKVDVVEGELLPRLIKLMMEGKLQRLA